MLLRNSIPECIENKITQIEKEGLRENIDYRIVYFGINTEVKLLKEKNYENKNKGYKCFK